VTLTNSKLVSSSPSKVEALLRSTRCAQRSQVAVFAFALNTMSFLVFALFVLFEFSLFLGDARLVDEALELFKCITVVLLLCASELT